MVRIALSLLVVAQFVSVASAGSYSMSSSCEMRNGNLQCSSYDSYGSGRGSGGRRMTKQEAAEMDARVQKWEAFCQPKLRVDEYGVARYSYAHAGCEFGRYE